MKRSECLLGKINRGFDFFLVAATDSLYWVLAALSGFENHSGSSEVRLKKNTSKQIVKRP
ncbi:MAG: hypothetical protein WCG14_03655 [Chlamydiia bacterium]|jgi:hypothetical protein